MLYRVALLATICATMAGMTVLADDSEEKPRGEFADVFTFQEMKLMRKKRVRREVRDLKPVQWQRITDAMNVMKFTNTEEGQDLYGPEYRSYDRLICAHARSVLLPDGDRSHAGPWFFLWHASFVKKFEDVLRLIDPRIRALPYVDWGRDGGVARGSSLFTDTYFGELRGEQSDGNYAIRGGPFDHWPVSNKDTVHPSDRCTDDFMIEDGFYNPYGFLRFKTNTNPSPYVTRMGDTVCGNFQPCEANLEGCLSTPGTIADYIGCSDIYLHLFNHYCVGGTVKRYEEQADETEYCLGAQSNVVFDPVDSGVHHANSPLFPCWNVPDSCDPVENGDWSGEGCMPKAVAPECDLSAYGLPNYAMPFMDTPDLQSWAGDLIDISTSPNDPLFMFIHNNVERNLQLWKLRNHHLAPLYGYPEDPALLMTLDRVLYPASDFRGTWEETLGSVGPYTMEDVLIATEFLNPDYTFDQILDLIYRERE